MFNSSLSLLYNGQDIFTCDASATVLGAVLSQEIDGYEKPMAYASRSLSDAERIYSVDALACIWAVNVGMFSSIIWPA